MRFLCAHKALESGFTERDRGFGPGDLGFDFVQTIRHLLFLDRIHTLAFGFHRLSRDWSLINIQVAIGRSRDAYCLGSGLLKLRRSALLAPEVVFVVSGIDFYFTFADFKNSRR